MAGNPSGEEFEKAFSDAREVFNGRISGFFDSKPAKYDLKVGSAWDKEFLLLRSELKGDLRDFIDEEERLKYWRRFYRAYETILCCHTVALLFPSVDVALVIWEHDFDRIKARKRKMEELGYNVARKKRKYGSTQWGNENKLALLSALRDPKLGVKAVDRRAIQILNSIFAGTFGVESCVFANYTPKHRRKPEDVYDDSENWIVHKIKKLIESPARWAGGKLEDLCKGLPLTRAIGISSVVQTKNGKRHIPMIDFNEGDPCETLDKIGMPGLVVASGQSYHFYGFDLQTDSEWKAFLGHIQYMPGVDEVWRELQLKQGFSMLRLTPARGKLYQPCLCRVYKPKDTGTDTNTREKRLRVSESVAA